MSNSDAIDKTAWPFYASNSNTEAKEDNWKLSPTNNKSKTTDFQLNLGIIKVVLFVEMFDYFLINLLITKEKPKISPFITAIAPAIDASIHEASI